GRLRPDDDRRAGGGGARWPAGRWAMSAGSKASSSPVLHSAGTGVAILEAAVQLFALRGYHATSMRDIAAAVDVRPAAVYHWYESKEAILVKLQNQFLQDLTAGVVAAVGAQRRPEARLPAPLRPTLAVHGL